MLIAEQAGDHQLLRTPSHPILIREVLSHTSGLPFASRVEPRIDTRPLREAVLSYALTNLKFEPGTKSEYANSGINTAGRIIEVVSGMPYEVFLQKRLFEPLGMKDTTFQPNSEQLQRLAKSYKPGPNNTGLEETTIGQLTYPLDAPNRYPCPAGGLFSTAADTGAFGMLILGGGVYNGKRLISEASVRQMTSIQTDHSGYGFGFSASKRAPADGSGTVPVGDCGHGGAYATDLLISPEHGITTVWMVQHAGYPKDGGRAGGEFRKVAVDDFGKK
jgi:CubicO group peptidase (beta-lactamase class C family)